MRIKSELQFQQKLQKMFRIAIGNTSDPVPDKPGLYDITLFVQCLDKSVDQFIEAVKYVRYDMDPSFSPPMKLQGVYPYAFKARIWCDFDVGVTLVWKSEKKRPNTPILSHIRATVQVEPWSCPPRNHFNLNV